MDSPTKGTTKPSPSVSTQNMKLKDENTDEEKGLWTNRRTEILLECLEEAKAKLVGNVHGRSFAPKMAQIASALKRLSGYDFSASQVKNYWTRLKKTHGVFKRMCQQTGITYDTEEGRIVAEEPIWTDVLLPMNYTEGKRIKEHGFPLFKRIDAIVGDSRATGTRAHPSTLSPSTSQTSSSASPNQIKQEKESGEEEVDELFIVDDNAKSAKKRKRTDKEEVFIDVDAGDKSGKKRKSLEKVKKLKTYDKGSSGSASKKRNESFSSVFASEMSGLNQKLEYRNAMLSGKLGFGGGSDPSEGYKVMYSENMTAVMQMLKEAKLTGASNAKALCLFAGENGPAWVHMFRNLEVSAWEDTLANMPKPSPRKVEGHLR